MEELTCPVCYLPDNLKPLTCGHDLCINCRSILLDSHSGINNLGKKAIKCPICRAVNQEDDKPMPGYDYPLNMRPGDYYINPNRTPGWSDYILVTHDGRYVHIHYDSDALHERCMIEYQAERDADRLRRQQNPPRKCGGVNCKKRTVRKCALFVCQNKCCRDCGMCQEHNVFLCSL